MRPSGWAAAVLAVLVALGGCARKDAMLSRLRAIDDNRAREVVSDALWGGGSMFAWAGHQTLRLEIAWTDHAPPDGRTHNEVWWLDTVGGRLRIESPEAREVAVFDGLTWRVLVDGRETDDLVRRAEAAGRGMMLRQLATLPFSLLDPDAKIMYVGTRTVPAEAKAWNRLFVTYAGGAFYEPGDRLVVEVNCDTRRIDTVGLCWAETPFLGGDWRVDMDEWFPAGDLVLSRRWRFTPVNQAGDATGPMRWTVRVTGVALDVPAEPPR